MDLLLSLVLSTAPLAPASPAAVDHAAVLDIEFAQAVLMLEHRLAIPIYFQVESDYAPAKGLILQ